MSTKSASNPQPRVEHRSGGSDSWKTPETVFRPLDEEFHFTLDAAASHENTQCELYLTEEGMYGQLGGGHREKLSKYNGLEYPWHLSYSELESPIVVWCNPPYSSWQKWVAKAAAERQQGATVVMLLPARTDTKAFHEHIWDQENSCPREGVEVRFIKGRVKFVGAAHGAPFPSMIVIFRLYT